MKLSKISHPGIQKQLRNFQKNANVIIPSSLYEIEIHRNRIKELELHCQTYEKKVAQMLEQQNYYMLMK